MDFSKYTTQELEFITTNFESFKKELEKRNVRKSDDFPFKTGDVLVKCGSVIKCMDVDEFVLYFCKAMEE